MTITIQGGWWGVVALIVVIAISVIVWFLKIYVPKKIESAVKHRYDLELEKFKNELTINATERNLRFSHVYAKTAEVIQEYFSHLADARFELHYIIHNIPLAHEYAKAVEKTNVFLAYHMSHSLYFPPESADEIWHVSSDIGKLLDLTSDQAEAVKLAERQRSNILTDTRNRAAIIESNLSKKHQSLTLHFQKFLGIVIK